MPFERKISIFQEEMLEIQGLGEVDRSREREETGEKYYELGGYSQCEISFPEREEVMGQNYVFSKRHDTIIIIKRAEFSHH